MGRGRGDSRVLASLSERGCKCVVHALVVHQPELAQHAHVHDAPGEFAATVRMDIERMGAFVKAARAAGVKFE